MGSPWWMWAGLEKTRKTGVGVKVQGEIECKAYQVASSEQGKDLDQEVYYFYVMSFFDLFK